MIVIIAGGRDYTDYDHVVTCVKDSGFEITEIVSGGATGADALGERYAKEHGIKLRRMPAEWKKHGKAAGPIRNREMAEVADGLIAFWDGESRGTKNMIEEAEKRGLKVKVYRWSK
jgi:hypothetical protein